MDSCNALYVGLNQSPDSCLKIVLPIFFFQQILSHFLRWLRVHFRINFKILMLVYSPINSLGLPYLAVILTYHEYERLLQPSS